MSQYPTYQLDALTRGDKRDLVYNQGTLQCRTIALDVAQNMQELAFDGDVFYCDRESTGVIGVKLDGAWPRAFPLAANGAIRGIPYKKPLLSWTAQPGLFVNLWFGYGVDIVAPSQDITSIGTITNPVAISTVAGNVNVIGPRSIANGPVLADLPVLTRDVGFRYATATRAISALAANTPEAWVTPAGNTNGLIVWSAQFTINNGGIVAAPCWLAKSSAPATVTDGDPILSADTMSLIAGNFNYGGSLRRPVFVAAGKGLYFIDNIAENSAQKSLLFTVL